MSLSDLASIGSFISGLAVLVSLVFLYFQLRQVNAQVFQAEKNQRALMQQGRSARVIETVFHRLEPHLNETMRRGGAGDLSLNDSQITSYVLATLTTFMNWEDSYLQHQAGTIEPAVWATDESRMKSFLSRPSYRACWRVIRIQFGGAFQELLDTIVRETKVVPSPDLSALWKTYLAEETKKGSV